MKIFLLICAITVTEGTSLWTMSRFKNSKMDFLVTRSNSSVYVKAFVINPSTVALDPTKNVKFFLFTRNKLHGIKLDKYDRTALLTAKFDFNAETKLLIHGFANSISSNFIEALRHAYMKRQTCNIVVVDWSVLCKPPFYVSAVDNARIVGARTAELLTWLVAEGANLSRLHILGHSIGAHIAGIVGQHLRQQGSIQRITGLDPAKPMFELESKDYRLSADDAEFVDCIHTCGGFLGLAEPTCSIDFYPNGGTNPQPGCRFDFFGTCSHQMAYKYFAESVNQEILFRAIRCSNVESYSPVNCSSSSIVTMGEYTDISSRGIFYLNTAASPPFSLKESAVPITPLTKFSWYFR